MSWDREFYMSERQVTTTLGDILVCQEFSNRNPDGAKNSDNFKIRTGQAIFSWMIKSSSNSEHAAIVYKGWGADNADSGRICDANVGQTENGQPFRGVAVRKWSPRDTYVYRCNNAALRGEAGNIAKAIATKVATDANSGGRYDWEAAAKCVPKFKYVDKTSKEFVGKCYDFAYGSNGVTVFPGMFCSEFVVVCYLVAAKRLGLLLGELDVDPRAISPKALQSLLERSSLFGRRLGRTLP